MFILFNMIVSFVFGFIDGIAATGGVIGILYLLVAFIPSLAVSIRRLHDAGHSGWWFLINIIPILGWIIYLVFTVQDSVPNTNQYGESPKSNSFSENKTAAMDELIKLNELKEKGIITEEEFQQKKEILL